MTDKEDNYEKYGIDDLFNSDIKEDEGGKYIIMNEMGEVSDCGEYFFKEYLKDEPQKQ